MNNLQKYVEIRQQLVSCIQQKCPLNLYISSTKQVRERIGALVLTQFEWFLTNGGIKPGVTEQDINVELVCFRIKWKNHIYGHKELMEKWKKEYIVPNAFCLETSTYIQTKLKGNSERLFLGGLLPRYFQTRREDLSNCWKSLEIHLHDLQMHTFASATGAKSNSSQGNIINQKTNQKTNQEINQKTTTEEATMRHGTRAEPTLQNIQAMQPIHVTQVTKPLEPPVKMQPESVPHLHVYNPSHLGLYPDVNILLQRYVQEIECLRWHNFRLHTLAKFYQDLLNKQEQDNKASI